MASKSLNLYFFSALIALSGTAVAYNTGMLDDVLADRHTDKAAISEPDATLTDDSAAVGDSTATEPAREEKEVTATEPAVEKMAKAADADIMPPRFDVVRVQPDGNVVIAGSAPIEAYVEVISGADVLGSTEANAVGDFAVVLSEPLKPGDYTIVLRATSPEKLVAMSEETAIVSVPEKETGDVLAIVDEPGKPSKLITVPEAEKAGEDGEEVAAADMEDVTAAEPDKSGDASGETAEITEKVAGADDATAVEAADARTDASEDVAAGAADKTDEVDVAVAVPEADEPEAVEQVEDEAPAPEVATPPPADQPSVIVEAVEIEGTHVFIAGKADPGKIVRVYANKELLGETQVSDAGRFLVESLKGLEVGEYIIRADLLDVGSAKVIARAAVPFEREPGEALAAVAPEIARPPAEEPAGETEKPADVAKAEVGDEADTQSDQPAKGETATGGGSENAASDADEDMVAKADIETVPPPQDGDMTEKSEAAMTGETAESAEAETGEDIAAADTETAEAATETEEIDMGEMAAETESADADESMAETGAGPEPAVEQSEEVAAAGSDEMQLPELDNEIALTAPKLQATSGAVIIRRGDTLWRISRRVYGRGIRYTTIYTANRDQIENPHRIWPGQIFDVPAVSDEGEGADLGAIADQLYGGSRTTATTD